MKNDENILRDLYLKKLVEGKLFGPLTGKPNIDKPWLKYYTENQINQLPVNKTSYQFMHDENSKYLDSVAIEFYGQKIKYNELFVQIEKVSKALKAIGVNKGDVVTICMPNTPESAYFFYACSKIGAIADFIDPRENEEGLEKYLNISNPKYLVMLDICFDQFKNLFTKKNIQNVIITSAIESLPVPIIEVTKLKNLIVNWKTQKTEQEFMKSSKTNFVNYSEFIKNGKNFIGCTEEPYEKDRGVAIVHTGGTTGIPKGVLLSNDNLNELTLQIKNSDIQFLRNYLLMGVMPEFVGYGLSVGLHTSLVCGMKTMMIAKYEPEKIPKLILKYKPNALAGSPAHWEIFSQSSLINKKNVDLSFLKAPIEGGDTLNINVEKKNNQLLKQNGCECKLIKGYGMTEKCSAVTACSNNYMNELGSVGAPFSKTNVAICDTITGEDLYYNQIGEICVSAPDVMLEYYNNPSETEKVLKKHSDGQTWLHSGDLGYINEKGILYVVGRIKDIVIRYDGIKIYPYNIESIFLKNSAIKDIAIIGEQDPNHYNGQVPVAFVILNEGYDEKEIMEKLKEYANKFVADYAIPVEYHVVDKLPLTKVGKVDKKKLKEQNNEEKVQKLKLVKERKQ